MNVTLYRHKKETLLMRTVGMERLVSSLRHEGEAKAITHMRKSLSFTLMGQTNTLLQRLPIIVFGAVYRRKEEKRVMKQYTGYVLLEVNGLANTLEAEEIRREAAGMPQTLLAFIGASERSVKIVVPFTLPDGSLPKKEARAEMFHKTAYQLAVKHFQPQLSSMITLKDPLLSRGCRMSYDIGLYYNPEAVAITLEQPLQMPSESALRVVQSPSEDPLERLMPGLELNSRIATLYSVALVEAIRATTASGIDELKPLWISLAEKCGQAGIPEEEAVGWTLRYESLKKHELEIRMTFRSAYLLKKWSERPLCFPESMSLVMLLEEFMERRYRLRYNEMNGEVEYLDRSSLLFTYQPFTTKARNSVCLEAQKEGLNVWDKDIDRYANSNRVSSYHPIESFLEELPAWDGKEHIRAVAGRITCQNGQWKEQFFRWFLSMVAHWMQLDAEHGNSTTPLLVGNQGCGKSTFCLQLLPPVLRNYYTDSIDFSKRRDTELALHRYALINMDEFDSVKPAHQSFLKHVLQKAVVNTRLPYQTASRNLRRYATFIATSNSFELLTDPTGSRRFVCVEVEGMIDNLQPIDYEQLYAEALGRLRRGERFWFTHEEESELIENNRQFQQIPTEEQLFLQYFTPATDWESGEQLLAVEILDRIAAKRNGFTVTKTMILNFGKLLKRNNVLSKRTKKGTFYSVVDVNN